VSPSLAGVVPAPSLSVQQTNCSLPYNQVALAGNYVVLGPGTYRPVFAGTATVGHPAAGGSAIAELRVRDALNLQFYSEFIKSSNGDVDQLTTFDYFKLTMPQTYVNVRSRVGASCGTASISGSVYFEKVD
jgi:hypothetical protein